MAEPMFIPQPRRVTVEAGGFPLDAATRLIISPQASPATRFAAQQLAEAITIVTALQPSVEEDSVVPPLALVVVGAGGEPADVATGAPSEVSASESYRLVVGPHGARLVGGGEAGLFYAVQTLVQALRTCGRNLPGLRVEDSPVLAQRGVMLDVSRGRTPTLDSLKRLAARLAYFKINQLQLYTEHTFLFSPRRDLGEAVGALTADEMRELDTFCRERHIELVPNLQSFGHQRALLSLPAYQHLDETGWRWTLSPAREETYTLLAEMYDEMLPAFSSSQFNIDCDETWDYGLGQSKALADAQGKGRVYLDHILRLRDLAARHGKTLQMWADIILDHPELLPAIPDDILLLDWRYEDLPAYPTVEAIARTGRRFMVCPGTSSWNTLFPRLDNAIGNIRGYTRAGVAHDAVGMLNTDWGDYGHYQQPSGSVYPFVFGAETAWTGGATEVEDFDRKVGPLVFGDRSGQVVAALRALGKAIEHPALYKPNRSDVALGLFDDPLGGRMVNVEPSAIAALRDAATQALPAFALLADDQMRRELSFVAAQVAFVADKLALTRDLRAALAADADMTPWLAALRVQRARLAALRDEFEALWLAVSKRSEIQFTLDHYDRALARHDAALAWLTAGNRDVTKYDASDDLILWEHGFKDLMDLVNLVGFDNLPPLIQGWVNDALQRRTGQ